MNKPSLPTLPTSPTLPTLPTFRIFKTSDTGLQNVLFCAYSLAYIVLAILYLFIETYLYEKPVASGL
jgi:hypothetical protein